MQNRALIEKILFQVSKIDGEPKNPAQCGEIWDFKRVIPKDVYEPRVFQDWE